MYSPWPDQGLCAVPAQFNSRAPCLGEPVILKRTIKEDETKATETFVKLSVRKGLYLPEPQKNFYNILNISAMTSGDNFTASDS